MSRFEAGQVYITNIFYGSVLYYITKLAFKKEHIDWFIKMVLWVAVVNLLYGIIQIVGYDFIYRFSETFQFTNVPNTASPNGFMGNSGITASFYCMCIPLMATRSDKSIWLSFILLIPIFMLHSAIALFSAIVIYMFLLWFKVNKKIWIGILILLVLLGGVYLKFYDMPGTERILLWKEALHDCNIHPVRGWGMDSFRKFLSTKNFIFMDVGSSQWDNPHNLIISLLYEFGFISLLLLGGYIRQVIIWFRRALKSPNTLALGGFILAFFLISMANFPMWVARLAIICIPLFSLYEVEVK